MFEQIGSFATRYRYPIILVWVLAAVLMAVFAPSISEVASSDPADVLPSDAPYLHAAEVYKEEFPNQYARSSGVIVLDASEAGGVPLTDSGEVDSNSAVGAAIKRLADWLNSDSAPDNIKRVAAPTDSSYVAKLTVSDDRMVAIVPVYINTSSIEPSTSETMNAIDQWLSDNLPAGMEGYQTGEAPIVVDTDKAVQTSVDRTIWVTVSLVVVLLLLIYRSPISPLIPLLTVTVAYFVTQGIVAMLGKEIMTITSYTKVMLVVVMYGAGTDYCLFLISRFREEMAGDESMTASTRRTVGLVGETITSSAATIFVGFMAMAFAEMGFFKTSGPALAIGVIAVLLAGLTFTPALLATLGERAFWPGKATHRAAGKLFETTSRIVSERPVLTTLVIVALMAPLGIYGLTQKCTYSTLDNLPDDKPAVVGFDMLSEHMDAGNMAPLTLVLTGRDPEKMASEIAQLTDELAAMDGIAEVRSLNSPFGQSDPDLNGLLRIDVQIRTVIGLLDHIQSGAASTEQLASMLNGAKAYGALLVERYPEIADDPNMVTLQTILNGNPLQIVMQREALVSALGGLADTFAAMPDAYLLPANAGDFLAQLKPLLDMYVSEDGTSYRLDVIFDVYPSGYEAMDMVGEIRDLLKKYEGDGEAVASGASVIITDSRDTMNRDQLRAFALVLAGIFIVLLLMLRSVVAPLYLIATVILSFTASLGFTNLVFKVFFDTDQLAWWTPFFTFVFLVALGIDYSIFLIGRVKEEVRYHGMRDGVHVAVAATGSIITSAGIILAGTFAAMMAGEIAGLTQIGFAVSVGVLVDTFVVRTMLVPALTTLAGRWAWWPGESPSQATTEPAPVGI